MDVKNENPGVISGLSLWWLALRPFAFPASAIPVLLGTAAVLSVTGVPFRFFFFILALLGMMMLQGASNLLNDAFDFRLGLDTEVFPASGAVVRKLLTPSEARRGAVVLFAAGSLIGIYLAAATSLHLLWIGMVGLLVGVCYSPGRRGLKYRALGDICVFVDFGLLGTLGAWTVQAGAPSWIPVIWSVPVGLLVIAILHANNWRDITSDSSRGFCSIASLLGDRGSLAYYGFLLFAPFLLVAAYVFLPRFSGGFPAMPFTCLLVMAALPGALRLFRISLKRPSASGGICGEAEGSCDFSALDGATGQFNLIFGLLLCAGFLPVILW